MKMKELEHRTGVNRESIRYYIREGLLPQPEKPKRNVAEYGATHVERTLLIKRLQDEHFLPLKVVKDILSKITDETSLNTLSRPALSQLLPTLIHDTEDEAPVSITALVASTDITRDEVNAMIAAGALSTNEDGLIPARDAEIAKVWGAARPLGFTAERGYDMSYLKRYIAIAEQWAELEAEQFLAAFAEVPDQLAAEAGAQGVEISNRVVTLLHTNALLKKIEGLTDG